MNLRLQFFYGQGVLAATARLRQRRMHLLHGARTSCAGRPVAGTRARAEQTAPQPPAAG